MDSTINLVGLICLGFALICMVTFIVLNEIKDRKLKKESKGK